MKIFLRFILVLLSLIGIYVIVSVLSCMIPSHKIQQNIERSAKRMRSQGDYPFAVIPKKTYQMDNFTDALILNQIHCIDNVHPFESFVLLRHQIRGDMTKTQSLVDRKENPQKPNSIYPRYWHGNTFLSRPLFLIADFEKVRWMLYAFTSSLLLFLAIVLSGKTNVVKTLAMMGGLLFANMYVTQFSIQFAPVWILSLLASILVCYHYQNKQYILMLFFVIGSLTAYMDLLTTPLLTLGIPLTVLFLIYEHKKLEISFIKGLKQITLHSLLWGVAYGFTWMSKWIIATLTTNKDVIGDAIKTVMFRITPEADIPKTFNRWDAIVGNADMLYWVYINIIICLLLIFVIFFFRKEGWKNFVFFIIIAVMPYVWFFIVANHSYLHYWYTYRTQAFS
ncbi:MAG: hypothetical protein PHH25_09075, partial [Bacteroidales bacterium]|nr:hypothetical protein [Bacteroidales bacterium]MDD3939849.1 hypothetical protein [Patescibacteria group bacterium]MDD4582503.1 hypothetical protein [Bacteroidales bacterium]